MGEYDFGVSEVKAYFNLEDISTMISLVYDHRNIYHQHIQICLARDLCLNNESERDKEIGWFRKQVDKADRLLDELYRLENVLRGQEAGRCKD